MANVYESIEAIIQGIAAAHKYDISKEAMTQADKAIAISYIESFEEKAIEEVKRFLRAYNDFKTKGGNENGSR